ncbi:MAG TPA: Nramp family divalent metal transporter [Bacillota bacterium]|nr:Nramp family divalent metal transporter [Bacillota bacterium]
MFAPHQRVTVPKNAGLLKKLLAFSGPGYLVAVGYMDPGNWATDLAGGSTFGYALLSVVALSSLTAMLLQHLALKLGIATGRNLAQLCREALPRALSVALWLLSEAMIIACDLAEVIGTAIALSLLFHLPLPVGIIVSAADTFALLLLHQKGVRYLEALVIMLIVAIVGCFALEMLFSQPSLSPLLRGFIPSPGLVHNPHMLLIATGILGATVMPHNLYLHSAVVQNRMHDGSLKGKKEAIRLATADSTIALTLAFFVNAAILILAAAAFYTSGHRTVTDIAQAHQLLTPILGVGAGSLLFAIALLASGQNSTVTATLAGQIILEGFVHMRVQPWLRRLITRCLAIIPACAVILTMGNAGLSGLLIGSQVVLSMQLPFAVIPLLLFTANKKHMGPFVNRRWLTVGAGCVVVVIVTLNAWLITTTIT